MLENAIENSLLPDCHVIYRPHPWRGKLVNSEDFLSLKWNHISIDPTMREYYKNVIKNPSGKMHLADYSISNKLLTLVDAVISPLSTMLIESLLKGKPCLAFFPETGQNEPTRVENLHFAEFIALKETNSCFKADQFIPTCQKL